jgi:hypothetical protein
LLFSLLPSALLALRTPTTSTASSWSRFLFGVVEVDAAFFPFELFDYVDLLLG